MPKFESFAAILDRQYRWPRAGDHPFVASGYWRYDATVNKDARARTTLMTMGYRKASELLTKAAIDDPDERDTLIYPIVFNYRHFIELSLKQLLQAYGPEVDVDPIWNTHDLVPLWRAFRQMISRYGIEDVDGTDSSVEVVVLAFAEADPGSFAYRYAMDRHGEALPADRGPLGLGNLLEVMEGVAGYFDGCDGYLDDLRGAMPDSY